MLQEVSASPPTHAVRLTKLLHKVVRCRLVHGWRFFSTGRCNTPHQVWLHFHGRCFSSKPFFSLSGALRTHTEHRLLFLPALGPSVDRVSSRRTRVFPRAFPWWRGGVTRRATGCFVDLARRGVLEAAVSTPFAFLYDALCRAVFRSEKRVVPLKDEKSVKISTGGCV